MTSVNTSVKILVTGACCLCLFLAGCETCPHWARFYQPPEPVAVGAMSDPIWQAQETNAEHADFIVYQHEFKKDTERLNVDGEDHVKQLAARLAAGQDAVVVVERSMTSPAPDSEFQYPVNPNPELDLRRREIVVRSLVAMGVADAENRVIVAPSITPGLTGHEAEAAYYRGVSGGTFGSPGIGGQGGFGGFMFGGGF